MRVTLGHFQHTDSMVNRVVNVLRSDRISYGPVSAQFEQEFAKHACDARYGVASNSGTSSLVVAIQAVKELYEIPDGMEVICPAVTFVATVNAVYQNRLNPVLVDVDNISWNMDVTRIRDSITDATAMILPVHMFGAPCDMDEILSIAEEFDLEVIEDCCEAYGAIYKDRPVGSFGSIGCFSTYVGHHVVTGVGGMGVTNSAPLASKMRSLVNHGIDTGHVPVGEHYDPTHLGRLFRFTSVGHSFRITELEAAIGLSQLENGNSERALERRRAVYDRYWNRLNQCHGLRVHWEDPRCHNSCMMLPMASDLYTNTEMISILNDHEIEARMAMPLTNQPCYDFPETWYPVAAYLNEHGFYVGCHEGITDEQVDYVCEVIEKAHQGVSSTA